MELIKLCCKYLADLLLHVFWVFPVRRNRLFIMNDLSHTYGGSPKYICEYLLAHEPEGTRSYTRWRRRTVPSPAD